MRRANKKRNVNKQTIAPLDSYAMHTLERLFAVFLHPCEFHPKNNTRLDQFACLRQPSRTVLHHPTSTTTPPLMLHIRPTPRASPPNRLPLPAPRRISRSRRRVTRDIAPPRTHRQPVTPVPRRRSHTVARRRRHLGGARRRPDRATPSDLLRLLDPAGVAGEVTYWVDAGADRAGPLVWVERFGDVDWSDGGTEGGF